MRDYVLAFDAEAEATP